MKKKLLGTAAYAGIAWMLYVYRSPVLAWIGQTGQTFGVTLAATAMALFPVIPYPVVGGVIGAAHGPVLGGAITWIGSTAASLIMFVLVRYGFQDWGTKLLHGRRGIDRMTTMLEQSAFLTILFARLIPIIPSIAVNTWAALSRMSFAVYATASALGKIPAMLLFAAVGDNLMTEPRHAVITVVTYAGFLAVTLFLYKRWLRKPT